MSLTSDEFGNTAAYGAIANCDASAGTPFPVPQSGYLYFTLAPNIVAAYVTLTILTTPPSGQVAYQGVELQSAYTSGSLGAYIFDDSGDLFTPSQSAAISAGAASELTPDLPAGSNVSEFTASGIFPTLSESYYSDLVIGVTVDNQAGAFLLSGNTPDNVVEICGDCEFDVDVYAAVINNGTYVAPPPSKSQGSSAGPQTLSNWTATSKIGLDSEFYPLPSDFTVGSKSQGATGTPYLYDASSTLHYVTGGGTDTSLFDIPGATITANNIVTGNFSIDTDASDRTYDLTGDGTSDILWQNNTSRQIAVWLMNSASSQSAAVIGADPTGWQIAGAGDFFDSGSAAILWQNVVTDQVAIWQMNGTTPTATTIFGAFPSGWQIAGVGDFNGDGSADILWCNPGTNQVAVWEMNGTTPIAESIVGTAPSAWKVAGVADFTGDGDADILWENTATNQVAIWEMSGTSVLAYNTIATAPSGWQIVGTGDFTGYGASNILWENTVTKQVAVWQTDGTSLTASAVISVNVPFSAGWQVAAVGDYYGAGTDAILWQNSTTGQAAIWQTNGTSVTATTTFASGIPSGWQIAHDPVLAA